VSIGFRNSNFIHKDFINLLTEIIQRSAKAMTQVRKQGSHGKVVPSFLFLIGQFKGLESHFNNYFKMLYVTITTIFLVCWCPI